MSPRRVLTEHTSRDLSEWMAYDRAIGLDREADERAGVIAAATWNVRGGMGAGNADARPATPADFFPRLADDDHTPSAHDDESDDTEADDEPAVEDAEAATQAMKAAFFVWGTRHNAAERAAKRLDAGQPPGDPDAN